VVKTLQQVILFFNLCRSFISAEKEFFHSDKIMEKKK